jgi:ribosomal protein S18 acetylase RimI-like enzyme
MSANYTYRKAVPADQAALKALGISSYSVYAAQLETEHWEKLSAFLHDEKKLEALMQISTCFVCVFNNDLVGMAYLIPRGNPNELFEAGWTYIRMVGVSPDHKGNGIAQSLTRLCLEQAKASGEQTVALHTSEYMDAARHIYEKNGFRLLKEIPPRFGKRYWLYTLDL